MTELRLATVIAILGGIGAILLLQSARWFQRRSLHERLSPFLTTATARRDTQRQSLKQLLLPNFELVAAQLARWLGITDSLERRLLRSRDARSPAAFRARELTAVLISTVAGVALCLVVRPPVVLGLLLAAGAPALVFLWMEQTLAKAVCLRQKTLFIELPVFAEQLAMLLGAGYSTGSALARLAERNSGVVGEELKIVCRRAREGLTTSQALEEWSDLATIPELDRLVAVLAVSSGSNDLGRLVSEEARAIRRETHRQLNEVMERRAQQVWIPVTVATLVPGVIFLIIPFTQALRLFSGT